jgi:membrane protease YdiL (CAAX protease family)
MMYRKWRDQWRSVGRVLLFLVAGALVLAVIGSLPVGQRGPLHVLMIGLLASLGSFALTVLFVGWDGLRLHDVGAMPAGNSLGLFAIGFAFGLFLVALHSFLVGVAGHVHWVQAARPTAWQACLVVTGYLFLAAREELAFHGYPLRRLQGIFGVWGAQATIAAVFALEHMLGGWSLAQALWGAAIGSLLFGMASIATRGLAVPIGMHAAWNVGDWLRGYKAEPGLWRPSIEAGFEAAATSAGVWCYVVVMALAIFAFWRWHRTRAAFITS